MKLHISHDITFGSDITPCIKIVNLSWFNMGLVARKPVFCGWRTTKAHTSLHIRAVVIRFLESIISKLATGQISIFYLVSVAGQAGLNLTLSETPKTGFLASRPIFCNVM